MGPAWDGLAEVRRSLVARGAEGMLMAISSAFYDRLRVVRGPTRFALREQVRDSANQSPLPAAVIGPGGLAVLGLEREVGREEPLDRAEPRPVTVEVRHGFSRFESRMVRAPRPWGPWLPGPSRKWDTV